MDQLDIPSEFYSFEKNAPFEHCIECKKYLLQEGIEYVIEKAVRNYPGYNARDIIFDYAICVDCASRIKMEVSKESWEQIMLYFKKNIDFTVRINSADKSLSQHLGECLVKKTKANDCPEYQLFAYCNGKKLNMQNPPYMLCGQVMDELLLLLSKKSIDVMNGFFKRHFSPDPTFFEPTPKLLLI